MPASYIVNYITNIFSDVGTAHCSRTVSLH